MQAAEDARAMFSNSGITLRTPAKKCNTPSPEVLVAPRKPAAKPTMEREEPSSPTRTASDNSTRPIKQQTQENIATVDKLQQTMPGSTTIMDAYNGSSPTKTLFYTALKMIKRTQAKLHQQMSTRVELSPGKLEKRFSRNSVTSLLSCNPSIKSRTK